MPEQGTLDTRDWRSGSSVCSIVLPWSWWSRLKERWSMPLCPWDLTMAGGLYTPCTHRRGDSHIYLSSLWGEPGGMERRCKREKIVNRWAQSGKKNGIRMVLADVKGNLVSTEATKKKNKSMACTLGRLEHKELFSSDLTSVKSGNQLLSSSFLHWPPELSYLLLSRAWYCCFWQLWRRMTVIE